MKQLCLLTCLIAGPALAEDWEYSDEWFQAIYDTCDHVEGALDQCIGLAAEDCANRSPGGQSNLGYANCLRAEQRGWENLLDRSRQEIDDHLAMWEHVIGTEEGAIRAGLAHNQTDWEVYRDSLCVFHASLTGPGSMAVPNHAYCMLRETAYRVDYMLGLLEFQ